MEFPTTPLNVPLDTVGKLLSPVEEDEGSEEEEGDEEEGEEDSDEEEGVEEG